MEFINKLGKGGDHETVGLVLDELVDYTVSHFAFEESLQEEADYKFAKPYKAVHDAFINRVAKYQEKHQSGEDVVKDIYNMLSTWLISHIKRDDMAYVSEVKANILGIIKDKQNNKEDGWVKRFFRF
ncbi:MAG: bacteriohemerythrin [Methylotenera sp.]|nr:bacteriohemerythrin [Methylotenera sp.]